MIHGYDLAIVGGGIAGLFSTLTAAEHCSVAVVSKVHVTRSHSVAAQGGMAASLRAQRYIFDTRISNAAERMRIMEKPHGIWSCKTYTKCAQACPKKIKVTEAILNTKKKILIELHPKQEKET